MTAHEMLCRALGNAASPGDPEEVVQGALEIAKHEADALHVALSPRHEAVLAAAIEGRLKALSAFIDANIDLTWKQGREPTRSESSSR